MIENIHAICVNAVFACAVGVGVAVVASIVSYGVRMVAGGLKRITAEEGL